MVTVADNSLDVLNQRTTDIDIDEEFSAVFQGLEQDMQLLSMAVTECASLPAASEISSISSTAETIRFMRKAHAQSLNLLEMLRTFVANIDNRAKRLNRKIDGFKRNIDRAALNYGINILPDDVLSEIMLYASSASRHHGFTFALSRVCKRFRLLALSSCQMWSDLELLSSLKPEEIRLIVKRAGSLPLKGIIHGNDQSLSDSSKEILSLHRRLRELRFNNLSSSCAEEIRCLLDGASMPALRSLRVIKKNERVDYEAFPCFYESCYMPILQSLDIDLIPRRSLGRNLVHCSLELSNPFRMQFLLEFVSSLELVKELCITFLNDDRHQSVVEEVTTTLHPTTIPTLTSLALLVKCDVHSAANSASLFMDKILLPSIRKLRIFAPRSQKLSRACSNFICASSTIEELQSECWSDNGGSLLELSSIFGPLSRKLEVLSVKKDAIWWHANSFSPTNAGMIRSHCLRLLRFQDCRELSRTRIRSLCDFLAAGGLEQVQFEFADCTKFEDGSFALDRVEDAFKHFDSFWMI